MDCRPPAPQGRTESLLYGVRYISGFRRSNNSKIFLVRKCRSEPFLTVHEQHFLDFLSRATAMPTPDGVCLSMHTDTVEIIP
jgi:hypothetical protein